MDGFVSAIRSAGIDPPTEIVADGRIHRFSVDGDGRKDKSGWYVLFDDPLAGSFGCWKSGIKETWHEKAEFTEEDRAEYRKKMKEARRERIDREERLKAKCREKAERIWNNSKPAVDHGYLEAKKVNAHGAKIYKGALVVPVRDSTCQLHGLQFIERDGTKKFLSGTAKKGCYYSIGKVGSVLCIAEGFATAATIYECTGLPVAAAFDAGNLLPVGRSLRAKFPNNKLIFCADNDHSGTGQDKAIAAAIECDGVVVMPPDVGEDINDFYQRVGSTQVAWQIFTEK